MLISYLDVIVNNLCYEFMGLFMQWDIQNMQFDVAMKNFSKGNNWT